MVEPTATEPAVAAICERRPGWLDELAEVVAAAGGAGAGAWE